MSKRKIKAEFALSDICDRYPMINKNDIELFAPVYYPLARIEADMNEKTFEDFDAVQESVLRFVSLGFKQEDTIADLMGLTGDYIQKMLKLLISYGHIDTNRDITELGQASLAEGQKITVAFTKQVFLLDALNCNIIRVDKDVDRTIVERADDVSSSEKYIAFMDHCDGISKTEIETTLKESQYNTLKRMPGGMNINVINVSDVRCLGIRYIKSYFIKLKNHSPLIFVKRFDCTGEGKERFFWLPFSVCNEKEKEFLNLEQIQIHNETVEEIINDVYVRIIERGNSERVEQDINKKLDFFTQTHFKIKVDNYAPEITISSENFFEYTNNALRVLKSFGKNGVYPLVDDDLSGNIIFFYPDKNDNELILCSELVNKSLEKFTYDKVVSFIEKNISDTHQNTIKNLLSVLKLLMG